MNSSFVKWIARLVSPLISIVIILMGAIGFSFIARVAAHQFGLVTDIIPISGTGSMYPTFPKGQALTEKERSQEIVAQVPMQIYPGGVSLRGISFFSYSLAFGDVISFSTEKTRKISKEKYGDENGFVKRVIGLPGDTVEIRNGFVIRNGQPLVESYTPRARGTFGGTFLPDCKVLSIPPGFVFVLGDNRVASNDSRYDIELISLSDIDHVLPFGKQTQFEVHWRDASNDVLTKDTPTLDAKQFIGLLNEKRTQNSVSLLKTHPSLVQSAKNRGRHMLKSADLSLEATVSGYPMSVALRDVGYRNALSGEAFQIGFLTAEELIEATFEFPDSREFVLNADYDDVGVSAVDGDFNGCPTQIIVEHFGGFVPPQYSVEERESWQKLLLSLNEAIPTWEQARSFEPFYQQHKDDLDHLLVLLSSRRQLAKTIVSRIEKNEWLTLDEEQQIETDESSAKEINTIIEKLNQQ